MGYRAGSWSWSCRIVIVPCSAVNWRIARSVELLAESGRQIFIFGFRSRFSHSAGAALPLALRRTTACDTGTVIHSSQSGCDGAPRVNERPTSCRLRLYTGMRKSVATLGQILAHAAAMCLRLYYVLNGVADTQIVPLCGGSQPSPARPYLRMQLTQPLKGPSSSPS